METRQLEYFVAVAEELSFTRAAARVFAVQSSVSAGVRALEAELGARLFERTKRSVALTSQGEALLPRARAVLDAVDEAHAAVAPGPHLVRGTVRLGVFTNLGYLGLPRVLAAFRERHPGVELRLTPSPAGSTGLGEDVRRGVVDVAFTGLDPQDHPGLRYTRLTSATFVAVLPAGHPLAGAASVAPGDLADEHVVTTPRGFGNRVVAERAFAHAGVAPRADTEVADVGDLPAFVAAGFGVAVVPADMYEPADGAVAVPLDAPEAWSLGLVTRPHPSAAAAALVAGLVHALASRPTPR